MTCKASNCRHLPDWHGFRIVSADDVARGDEPHIVKVFGAARPHHAYLFANKSSTRMKVLVYDGFGIWLAARRLNKGRFIWTNGDQAIATALNPEQLRALVTGLPWQTLTHDHAITVV